MYSSESTMRILFVISIDVHTYGALVIDITAKDKEEKCPAEPSSWANVRAETDYDDDDDDKEEKGDERMLDEQDAAEVGFGDDGELDGIILLRFTPLNDEDDDEEEEEDDDDDEED